MRASRLIEIIAGSLRLEQVDYAARVARGLLRYHPRHQEARCLLGQVLLEGRRLRDSKAAFEAVLKADPENVEATVGLAMAAWARGDLAKAGGWLWRARELAPYDPDLTAAAAAVKGAPERGIGESPLAEARQWVDQAEFGRAVGAYDRAMAAEPCRAQAALGKLEALWRAGRLEEAAPLAEELIRKRSQWVKPYLILADIHQERGDSPKTEEAFRQAHQLDASGLVARRLFRGISFRRGALPEDVEVPISEMQLLGSMPPEVKGMLGMAGADESSAEEAPPGAPLEAVSAPKGGDEASRGDAKEAPVCDEGEDGAEHVLKEMERLASRLLPVGQEGLLVGRPVELVISSRKRLSERFGEEGFRRIDEALGKLIESMEPHLEARLVYVDDAEGLRGFGLEPADARDPQAIAGLLRGVHGAMGREGRRVSHLLLVGGDGIIPHHELPNPTDDEDERLASDNPYASWGDLLVPDRAIGRLPDGCTDDPALLLGLIETATAGHRGDEAWKRWLRGVLEQIGVRWARSVGYAAQVWEGSSREVFSAIGEAGELMVTPPLSHEKLAAWRLEGQFGYFNLHGVKGAPPWYGQRGAGADAAAPLFPVALMPSQVARGKVQGMVVFTEACYGGHLLDKGPEDCIALRFLASGAMGLVGATGISYGSLQPPLYGADLLAWHFWKGVTGGATLGDALRAAKEAYARKVYQEQGYLDNEDVKTLQTFVLYGDPSLRPLPSLLARRREDQAVEAMGIPRLCQRDRGPARVPRALVAQVHGFVRDRLAWAKDAAWSVRRQVVCAGSCGAMCSGDCGGRANSKAPTATGLVFTSKGLLPLNGEGHVEQIVKVTVDEQGVIRKALVSRGGPLRGAIR